MYMLYLFALVSNLMKFEFYALLLSVSNAMKNEKNGQSLCQYAVYVGTLWTCLTYKLWWVNLRTTGNM